MKRIARTVAATPKRLPRVTVDKQNVANVVEKPWGHAKKITSKDMDGYRLTWVEMDSGTKVVFLGAYMVGSIKVGPAPHLGKGTYYIGHTHLPGRIGPTMAHNNMLAAMRETEAVIDQWFEKLYDQPIQDTRKK